MLWIVTLFGIAVYLIYIEYSDYKLRRKLTEFGLLDSPEDRSLMGDSVEEMDRVFREQMSSIEQRVAKERERFADEIAKLNTERNEARKEHFRRKKEELTHQEETDGDSKA